MLILFYFALLQSPSHIDPEQRTPQKGDELEVNLAPSLDDKVEQSDNLESVSFSFRVRMMLPMSIANQLHSPSLRLSKRRESCLPY